MPLTQINGGMLDSIAQQVGFRNRIINGAMQIDQRNAGVSVTINTLNVYTIDRWSASESSGAVFTVQQDSSAPAGFVNSARVTITTADATISAAEYNTFQQRIEGFSIADLGWGTAAAHPVTLSFWVRSSLTGTFGGAFTNGAYNRSYPFTYTISNANTWEYKTITIAGDTTGTWLTTNGIGIQVYFDLGSGTDNTGTAGAWVGAGNIGADSTVQLATTLSATWQVTGVQLEKGSTATSFDYRPYGTELALCQRYYQFSEVVVFSASNIGAIIGSSQFSPQMRATPTMVRTGNGAVTTATAGTTLTPRSATFFDYFNTGTGTGGSYTASAEL
jgi:hypothetical protein